MAATLSPFGVVLNVPFGQDNWYQTHVITDFPRSIGVVPTNTTPNVGVYSFTFRCDEPMTILTAVNAPSTSYTIYDSNNNPLFPTYRNNTTLAPQASLKSGVDYTVELDWSSPINGGTIAFRFQGQYTPTVSTFFLDGFIDVSNSIPKTIDTYGQITYTFTNVPVVANQPISLCTAVNAREACTVTVTPSNPSIMSSSSTTLAPYASFLATVTPLFSGTVNLTVLVGINGVGTTTISPIIGKTYVGQSAIVSFANEATLKNQMQIRPKRLYDEMTVDEKNKRFAQMQTILNDTINETDMVVSMN